MTPLFAITVPLGVTLGVLGAATLAAAGIFVFALVKHSSSPGSAPTAGGILGGASSILKGLDGHPLAHLVAAALTSEVEQIGKNTGHAILNGVLTKIGLAPTIPLADDIVGKLEDRLAKRFNQPQQPAAPAQPATPDASKPGGWHLLSFPDGSELHKFVESFNKIHHRTGAAA